ncbi:hypothetical protein BDL97_12G034100 [Sphagnum fallax]|nr:hypothetical protein BDL97_12G034100 [Sphagnum fallax]
MAPLLPLLPRLLLHILWLTVCFAGAAHIAHAVASDEYLPCEAAVHSWAIKETEIVDREVQLKSADGLQLRDLLFFLHIPRTGGRTYHQCFLKQLFLSEERCRISYDKLRFDPSQPSCKIFSTHDDFSIMHKLDQSSTSAVTNLRHPLDRVLSTYEFSVEVAARFLRLKKGFPGQNPFLHTKSTHLVSTLSIWPWKYLVPFMQRDIFMRRDARLEGHVIHMAASANTSYDAASIVMSLLEFIHHPVAHELVHNGAMFQVAGLTNNSFIKEAGLVHKCVERYPQLGHQVLHVAKRRLDGMLYVGLTEKQQESASIFLGLMGDQVSGRLEALQQESGKQNVSAPGQQQDAAQSLWMAYNSCTRNLQASCSSRRAAALQLIPPIIFSKEERKLIPDAVVEDILSLNSLDLELYEHAEMLYAKQKQLFLSLNQPQVGDDLELLALLSISVGISGGTLAIGLVLWTRKRVGKERTPVWRRVC